MRGEIKRTAQKGAGLNFGEYGLKALRGCWLTARQIEAARKSVMHLTKRGGRFWIRVFPDKPVTKRPPEVRMGGGKGLVDSYVAVVSAGRMLFEIGGVTEEVAMEAFKRATQKLPIPTRFVRKEDN